MEDQVQVKDIRAIRWMESWTKEIGSGKYDFFLAKSSVFSPI